MRSGRPLIVYTIPYTWRLAGLVIAGFAIIVALLGVLAVLAALTHNLFRFPWW